jgi:hypothetical protein
VGQYHGAGVFTGFGLLFLHMAQRKRLPFIAVFGRFCLPVLSMFFAKAQPTSASFFLAKLCAKTYSLLTNVKMQ